MFTEEQLIPISALQHYVFCPRQCGLIHIEQIWADNRLTAEGSLLHRRVHDADDESRPGVRVSRGLRLVSHRLGLVGQADVVEFRNSEMGIELPSINGYWQPFPVEYKRGKAKPDSSDRVQLCAQAMCLEEMLEVPIPEGAIFYGLPRRRQQVEFVEDLRKMVIETAQSVRGMLKSQQTPRVKYLKRCDRCSIKHLCLPRVTGVKKDVEHYMQKAVEET